MKGLLSNGLLRCSGPHSLCRHVKLRPKTKRKAPSAHLRRKNKALEAVQLEHQTTTTADLDASFVDYSNTTDRNTNTDRDTSTDQGTDEDTDTDTDRDANTDKDRVQVTNSVQVPNDLVDHNPSTETVQEGPIIPAEWESTVQSVLGSSPASVVFICGGKNTGKSTFARYLLNSLLKRYNKVGFLDTDVGQPELTPSGCLSLHVMDESIAGLPALEMKNPERCYFFGDVSPKTNPKDYLNSIFSLYDHFHNKYRLSHSEKHFPLVVNTHGWVQGIGFDVLVDIACHIKPTHVVQILAKSESKNLPQDHFWEYKTPEPFCCELLYVDSVIGGSTELAEIKYNARELRDLRLVSYFQNGLKEKTSEISELRFVFAKAATALAFFKPFQVPISAIKIVHQHCQVPASELIYSLSAAIVGLGVSSERENNMTPEPKPICVGLGIVRAVDIQKGVFYVIAPLQLDQMQQVNTFLRGRIDIPVPLLQAPGYISPYLSRNTIRVAGTGSAVMGDRRKKLRQP